MIIIAIDPDVKKCGVCILSQLTYEWFPLLSNDNLWELFRYLETIIYNDHIVIIEAGWLHKNKSWHGGGKGSAYDVGRNHEVGMQIERFCKAKGINYRLEKPRGYSSFTHKDFIQITGWKHIKKSNPETRVAGLFAYHEIRREKLLSMSMKKK